MKKANALSSKPGKEQYAQLKLGKEDDSKTSVEGTVLINIPGGADAPGKLTLRGAFTANEGGDATIGGVTGSPDADYAGIRLWFPFTITPGSYEIGVGKQVHGVIAWRWRGDELPLEPITSGTFQLTDYNPSSVFIKGTFKDLQYEGRKPDIEGTFKTD